MAKQKRWDDQNLRSPWERIIRAYNTGTGCRLSVEDCIHLGSDDAIVTRAILDEKWRHGECDDIDGWA